MRKLLLLIVAFTAVLTSCSKKDDFDPIKQAEKDDAQIREYLAANNIDAIKDTSGMYYMIINPGIGQAPGNSSAIKITYTGKLLSNGSTFDQGENVQINIKDTNQGLQIGIKKLKKGGRAILLIPSGLANGRLATERIPANSVLLFDLTLVDVDPL